MLKIIINIHRLYQTTEKKMNKKIVVGSVLTIFMLMLLPSTSALHEKTGLNGITKLTDFTEIQNMNIGELIDFIMNLAEGNPEIQDEIMRQIEGIENKDIFQIELEELADSNQSLIEKIWFQVFNYRLFRLYISFWILVYTQSRISLLKTIDWAMKLLRWIQVGIILGIVDLPDYNPPETPTILFEMDLENNTLVVNYISPENILWNNIDQIGSGTCDPLPTGNITVGDEITNCLGIIVLRYIPTNEVLGVFEFE
jgi:hypothetical protein